MAKFNHEERLALEKYWKYYVQADPDLRPDLEAWIGRLFCLSPQQMEQQFILIGEDILDGAHNARSAPEAASCRPSTPGEAPASRHPG